MVGLNRQQLQELAVYRAEHCVSLFLPTHRSGLEQQQNGIRFRNQLDRAKDQLLARGLRRPDAEAILQPAEALRRDELFWRTSLEGLACFCAAGMSRVHQVSLPLEELVCVAERFRIQPLLPLVEGDERCFILALNQNDAHLFEAARQTIREVELPPIAHVEVDGADQTLQSHTQHASRAGGISNAAIFHGQGGPADRTKEDIRHFFARVDAVVARKLRDERAPLILACVEYLVPVYKSVNHCRSLLDEAITGSPAQLAVDEIHKRSWRILEGQSQAATRRAFGRLNAELGFGRGSTHLREIVLAADEGRVDTLFVTRGVHRWGRVNGASRTVEMTDGQQGEELLDFAAARTLSCRGEVHAVENIPGVDSPLAAILRY